MRASEFILEYSIPKNKWELLISDSDKTELGDNLVDLVTTAYSNTPQGSFVNSIKDVIPSDWNVIDWDEDPNIDATVFYRGPRKNEQWTGYKIQGIGHDGKRESKDRAISKVRELLNKNGWWIESSDAMRHILLKAGVNPVTDLDTLQQLFNDKNLKLVDEITYVRELPNTGQIKETVFGKPIMRANEFVSEDLLNETAEESQIINLISDIIVEKALDIYRTSEFKQALRSFLTAEFHSPKDKLELWGLPLKRLKLPTTSSPAMNEFLDQGKIKFNIYEPEPSRADVAASYSATEDGRFPMITVNLLVLEKHAGKDMFQWMKRSIAHEITHAIDQIKTKGAIFKGYDEKIRAAKSDDEMYNIYLNLPAEINARFSEALFDTATQLKQGNTDLVGILKTAFEQHDLNILSRNQYKRLLTRAYKFFDAEKRTPKREEPIQNIVKRAFAWVTGKPTTTIK